MKTKKIKTKNPTHRRNTFPVLASLRNMKLSIALLRFAVAGALLTTAVSVAAPDDGDVAEAIGIDATTASDAQVNAVAGKLRGVDNRQRDDVAAPAFENDDEPKVSEEELTIQSMWLLALQKARGIQLYAIPVLSPRSVFDSR